MFDNLNNLIIWIPQSIKIKAVCKMPTSWIEHNFEKLNVSLKDIFHKKTNWTLEFLGTYLTSEETELWDYVSEFYTLDKHFCEKYIDYLNFHILFETQLLPNSFFFKYKDKMTWVPKHILDKATKDNILKLK